MTAIQRFALHGTIMNPHSHGPYVRHEDHLAAMQGRCLTQIEEPAGAAPAAVAGPAMDVTLDEDQDEGAVLLASLPAPAAPALEAPAGPAVPEYTEGGRESVDDALAIVESFGTGIEGLNDEFARQILLAAEVRRLRDLYEQAVNGRSVFRDAYRKVRGAILPPLGCPACDITHAAKDCPQESALAAAPQAPAAPVAHLDLGAGGYMDLGTDLSEQQLGALPKGRHMLAIIGTYGIDGYAAAPAAPAEAQRLAQFLQDRQTCLGSSRASAGKYNQQSWDDYERAWTMLLGMAAPAAPAVDAWLQPDDMAALQRFHETAEDDESYDIGKEAVARLCAFGCLQSHSFGRYSTTDFGDYLLDTWAGARTLPFTTAAEREARAAQAKEGGAPVADAAPLDVCTDPYNCARCKTHPAHRGDMHHAGISRIGGSA